MMIVLTIAALSGAISFVLTAMIRAYAVRNELLDRPNERSSHSVPTPRGGGLAIVATAAAGLAVCASLNIIEVRHAVTLASGMIVLGIVGWLDDTRSLRAEFRLAVHLAVACWTLYRFGGLTAIRTGDHSLHLGAAGYLLGALGLVWSINLFNFMDGIDGLAGSQATIIFASGSVLFLSGGNLSLAAVSALLTGASAGFLAWNWPPAKIFMGDVGSGAIGYMVAGLAIASENEHSVPLLVFLILGALFVADATVTVIRRTTRGGRIIQAHRDHAYQRLSRAWGNHRSVTACAALVTLTLAMMGAAATSEPRLLLPGLIAAYLLLAAMLIAVERAAPM